MYSFDEGRIIVKGKFFSTDEVADQISTLVKSGKSVRVLGVSSPVIKENGEFAKPATCEEVIFNVNGEYFTVYTRADFDPTLIGNISSIQDMFCSFGNVYAYVENFVNSGCLPFMLTTNEPIKVEAIADNKVVVSTEKGKELGTIIFPEWML